MKRGHAGFWVGLTCLFVGAVYSVIVFLLKSSFDLSAWVLYGFTMVAFLLLAIQSIAFTKSGSGVVMDTALSVVTLIYFGIQFIFGGIVCMCFADLPTTPVLVCEMILLAAYLAIAFSVYGAQSHMAAQDQNDQSAVRKLRLLESDIQGMADQQTDPSRKQALKNLAEEIHYSDATSLPALADIDGKIALNVIRLQNDLADEGDDPLARVEIIRQLLKERERTAAILKR